MQAAVLVVAGAQIGIIGAISALAAPAAFATMSTDAASRYLRRLFPRYFATAAILAVIAGVVATLAGHGVAGALLAGDALCFVAALALVPRINAARDQGDPAFGRLHGLSVVLNMVGGLLAIAAVIVVGLSG